MVGDGLMSLRSIDCRWHVASRFLHCLFSQRSNGQRDHTMVVANIGTQNFHHFQNEGSAMEELINFKDRSPQRYGGTRRRDRRMFLSSLAQLWEYK
jgi:hypothetical protein